MFAVNEECLMALLIIRQRVVDLFIYFLSLSLSLSLSLLLTHSITCKHLFSLSLSLLHSLTHTYTHTYTHTHTLVHGHLGCTSHAVYLFLEVCVQADHRLNTLLLIGQAFPVEVCAFLTIACVLQMKT